MLQQNQSVAITETARKVFIRGLEFDAFIGAYPVEMERRQRIRIDLTLELAPPDKPIADNIDNVVCYHKISTAVGDLLDEGHIKLVETLAERILDLALGHPLVGAATVRIEKPMAIDHADGVGVEIRRAKG